MALFRMDPGPCIICGAPHTTCTGDAGPYVIQQTPMRDAIVAAQTAAQPTTPAPAATPVFSTASYRRALHKPR